MATIQRFEDIEAWKSARKACNLVYELTRSGEISKDYALTNQLRRAAISIASNIAEGFEREGNKEFLNFLSIAKGSCGEVKTQLYVARDQNYIDEASFSRSYELLSETSRIISGFMKYLRQTELRGHKFKQD